MRKWLNNLAAKVIKQSGARAARRQKRPTRLGVEMLETRVVPSIVPTSTPIDVSGLGPYVAGQTLSSSRSVAESSGGNFRVVWQDNGIYTRLFNSAGTPLTAAVHLGTTDDTHDSQATVAMDAGGESVVAWTHNAGGKQVVMLERFNSAGAVTNTAAYSSYLNGNVSQPSVAMDAAGDYVLALADFGGATENMRAWLVRPNGLSVPLAVGSSPGAYQPSVAMNDAGNFVIAYASDQGIFAQQFGANTLPKGAPLSVVRSALTASQPSAAIDAAGDFAVAYTNLRGLTVLGAPTHYESAVEVARFNAAGARLGTAAVAGSLSVNDYAPCLAMDAAGNYVVAYTHGGKFSSLTSPAGYPTVRAVAYYADGTFRQNVALATVASPTGSMFDTMPSVAMSAAGQMAAAWQDVGTKTPALEFGPTSGVFAQTFAGSPFQYKALGGGSLTVYGGLPATYDISITRDPGFTGPITVGLGNLPPGVAFSVTPDNGAATQTRTITFYTSNQVPQSLNDAAVIQISSGATVLTSALTLNVYPSAITGWTGPNGGPLIRGMPATIYGSGFVPGSRVYFGSLGIGSTTNVATPSYVSPDGKFMIVTVPAGAVDGFIGVVRPGATIFYSATSAWYSYGTITGLSTWTGYAPGYSAQYLNQGSSVTIYGSGFLPGSKVQFGHTGTGAFIDPALLATPTAIDPNGTWMTVNVPRYAVDGPVLVQLPDGHILSTAPGLTFQVEDYRNTFGFSFANWPFRGLTDDTFRAEFPGQIGVTTSTIGSGLLGTITGGLVGALLGVGTDLSAQKILMSQAENMLNGIGGVCFGMDYTSLLLASNASLLYSTGALPAGSTAATVFNLQQNATLDTMLEQNQLAQVSAEMARYCFGWITTGHSAASVHDQIMGLLQTGQHPIITLGSGASHAVVAYDLEPGPNGNGDYYIDVYDPNRPFGLTLGARDDGGGSNHMQLEQSCRIYIDPASGWSFTMSDGSSYSGTYGSLIVVPMSVFANGLTMPASLYGIATIFVGADGGTSPDAAHTKIAGRKTSPLDEVFAAKKAAAHEPAAATTLAVHKAEMTNVKPGHQVAKDRLFTQDGLGLDLKLG
jgi:hypothetical protein